MTDSTNPHLAVPLRFDGPPPGTSTFGAVLVHGRGQTPDFMADMAERAGMAEVYRALPEAHENSWYPDRFMEPLDTNEPRLSYGLEAVEKAIAALHHRGFGSDHIALIGFSQGACLLAEYLVRRPRRYGAVALLTGGYIGPDDVPRLVGGNINTLRGTPVLLSSSEVDEWVPPSRVRQTADLMQEMGASVTLRIHTASTHGVDAAEIRSVRQLLAGMGFISP